MDQLDLRRRRRPNFWQCVGAGNQRYPDCQIVGVEPVAGNDVQLSLQQDQIVHIEVPETIAGRQQTTSPGIHTLK